MIRWFARNDVAANFLLIAILVLGLRAAFTQIPLEVRPSYEFREVEIRMSYRGGTPEDVERTIVLPIEQAMEGLAGVKEIRSEVHSGSAEIELEPDRDADIDKMLEEVQRRVESISTFPNETERPRIRIPSTDSWWEVCTVMVYGDLSEDDLLKVTHQVRDDLLNLPGISQVQLTGNRDREIGIETDPDKLQSYGLSIQDLTDAIRRSSIDLPAGSIRTSGGRMLLRTKSQAYDGDAYRNIIIRAQDGAQLRLGDVAKVTDGFQENRSLLRYNRERAMRIEVLRSGSESAIDISNSIRDYLEKAETKYPEGIELAIWDDESISMRGRLSILASSLAIGAVLVLILLGLFLRPMLAFFVMIGIPVGFAGGLALMPLDLPFVPWGPMTLNLMSVFGFIIVVGIVVDDAIVTGENIYSKLRKGMDPLEAAVLGTKEVATPVTFGVLTTIVAFLPLMSYDGFIGNFARQIPPVVAGVLIFSLIESKLILPSHLKHLKTGRTNLGPFARFQKSIADGLEGFVHRVYKPFLHVAAKHRYVTLAIFVAMGLTAIGYRVGGHIKFADRPKVDRYQIYCSISMPSDTPFEKTDEVILRLTDAAEQLADEFKDPKTGESLITAIMSGTGTTYRRSSLENQGMVSIEILPPSMRSEPGPGNDVLEARLREIVGPLHEADRFRIYSQDGYRHDESAIQIELRGPDSDKKREIADQIEDLLEGYEGIYRAGSDKGRRRDELEITLKDRARELGLTEVQLARQVRSAFFGDEAQRIQRDREEIRVMIRLPERLRENLHTLYAMQIRTTSGETIPFSHVANATVVQAPSRIERKNGARVMQIGASSVDKSTDIISIAERAAPEIDEIVATAGGVLNWRYTGSIEEHYQTKDQNSWNWWILIIALYALLAIPFRGLLQPIFVLAAIPFGLIGALIGHVIMGIPLTHLSSFGMMALAGVVVNDSLVMVDFANRRKRDGADVREAILMSGVARFRPIVLTSLTTFVGLLPLILDKSIQAQFLIPMAVSLAFGILFSTAVTLLLIPCFYLAFEDGKELFLKAWRWYFNPFKAEPEPSIPPPPPPTPPSAPPRH